MSNEGFNFSKFIKDSKDSLLKPKDYFAAMPTSGGFAEPIIKAVLYGLIAGIITFIWSLLSIGSVGGGMLGGLFGGAVGVMALIWSVVGALIGLFIGGVIILIVSAICGGSTGYEANVRVAASLMVISPVKALFGFLAILSTVGSLVGFVISLYAIWMLYHALIGSLKAKPQTSKIIGIVLAVLIAIFSIIGMASKKAITGFSDKYEDVLKEAVEEYEDAAKEMLEDLDEDQDTVITDKEPE